MVTNYFLKSSFTLELLPNLTSSTLQKTLKNRDLKSKCNCDAAALNAGQLRRVSAWNGCHSYNTNFIAFYKHVL